MCRQDKCEACDCLSFITWDHGDGGNDDIYKYNNHNKVIKYNKIIIMLKYKYIID